MWIIKIFKYVETRPSSGPLWLSLENWLHQKRTKHFRLGLVVTLLAEGFEFLHIVPNFAHKTVPNVTHILINYIYIGLTTNDARHSELFIKLLLYATFLRPVVLVQPFQIFIL